MLTHSVRLTTIAMLAGGALAGCLNVDEEYRKAVPTNSQVTISVPAAGAKAAGQSGGVGESVQALVGQTSEYYQFTFDISTFVNGAALGLLGLLHAIVEQHPTTTTANSRTWGPWTPGGLDPLTYRAVVTKADAADYSFSIEARPRASNSDGDFLALLDGKITRGITADTGKGNMTLHFDNGRTLRPVQCEQGTVAFVFDDTQPSATLDVTFTQFANNNPKGLGCKSESPGNATYHYDRTSDGAGDFVFSFSANVNKPEENKPLPESVSIRSRWLGSGAGRSDVRVSGGEVATDLMSLNIGATEVVVSQCWDTGFATVYETSTPAQAKLVATAGDPSKCAFTSQQLP